MEEPVSLEERREGTVLVGACAGDPYDPATLSGVPRFLFDALERRYPFAARLDYRLRRGQRTVAAARTFRLPRSRWQERYHLNKLSQHMRSRNLRRELARISRPFDLVVQVRGWVDPHRWPYVICTDGTWHMASTGWPAWLPAYASERDYWYEVERRMYGGARHVFAVGLEAADSLRTFYGVPPERVTVVGGGVNFETLPEVPGRELEDREPVILFVGRDYLRKGCDVLLSAFRLVRERFGDARLQLVGLSPPLGEPGVESLGVISDRKRLQEAYSRAAVFCLPSRYEPYGLVLPEAMAYGLPCIGTTVGAIPEIIAAGETGLLVPPDDPHALAAALLAMLEHPRRAASFGAAGRRRVERELNWDRVADRMVPGLERAASA